MFPFGNKLPKIIKNANDIVKNLFKIIYQIEYKKRAVIALPAKS